MEGFDSLHLIGMSCLGQVMPSPRRRASLPRAVMAVSWATLTLSTSAEDGGRTGVFQ